MMGEILNVLEEEPKPTKELESTEYLTQASREPYTRRYYSSDVERFDVPLGERSRVFFDKDAFVIVFFEFKDIIKAQYTEENETRLLELYAKMRSGLPDVKTDISLAKYDYYLGVNNQKNAEFYTSKEDMYNSYSENITKKAFICLKLSSQRNTRMLSAHISEIGLRICLQPTAVLELY